MSNVKIKNVIDILAKYVNVDDDKKEKLYSKYASMSDIEAIKSFSQIAYIRLKDNPKEYDYALSVIRSINPEVCPPVEEMKDMLVKMFANEIKGNIVITNQLGQVVKEINIDGKEITIDIEDLTSGIYFLNVSNQRMKFLKN